MSANKSGCFDRIIVASVDNKNICFHDIGRSDHNHTGSDSDTTPQVIDDDISRYPRFTRIEGERGSSTRLTEVVAQEFRPISSDTTGRTEITDISSREEEN